MKPIAKLFSLLLAIFTLGVVLFWWWRILNRSEEEDDPYYIYGDSLYRGDEGEPIRYESDEEADLRKSEKEEEPFIPKGYPQAN